MSDILRKARIYEENGELTISPEERPVLHLSPRVGWMNDPNGFCVYQGKYHLFYQYYPYATQWGPMHWGHAVSDDLIRWQYLPAAMGPDTFWDSHGCFSGSGLELEDGRQLLMYTGSRREQTPEGRTLEYQTQCIALGDGLNYQKYGENPVLTGLNVPEGFSVYDFRDPKLFHNADGSFGCVIGCRDGEGGAALLYRSDDGLHWVFVSVADRSAGEFGSMWECPDLFAMGDTDILLINPQQMMASGLEFHPGNCTAALLGRLENGKFHRNRVQNLDYGLDFYAPQTIQAPDGRRILIAWMQNWDTLGICPENAKWFGQMTLPRELTLREGRLLQNPVRELERYRTHPVCCRDVEIQGEAELPGVRGRLLDLTVTVRPGEETGFEQFWIKFAADDRFYTELTFCPGSSTLRLSRMHSGVTRDCVHQRACPVADRGGEIKLRIILDRFSAEVFVNGGEQTMTTTFYTPIRADHIRFGCRGKSKIDLDAYRLAQDASPETAK